MDASTALVPSDASGTASQLVTPKVAAVDDEPTNAFPQADLIFGWRAKMPTLRKYKDAYRKLYPSSAQVVVCADPLRYWKLRSAQERAVLPAVQSLQETGLLSAAPGSPPPRILIHALSNGGIMSLYDMAAVLRRRNIQSPPGTKCAIIFDSAPTPPTSAPAPPTFTLTIRAFTAGLRGWLRKLLTGSIVTAVYILTAIIRTLFHRPRALAREIAGLNDPALLPWTSRVTPRLYLYSVGDVIVPASAVEEHAAHARMAGFPVQMVNFGQSAHVSHARDYPEKYWGAVREFWSETVGA